MGFRHLNKGCLLCLLLVLAGCAPSALIHEIGGDTLFIKRVRTRDGYIPISFFDRKVELLTSGGRTTIALHKFATIDLESDSLQFFEGNSWVKTTFSMAEIEKGSDRLVGYIKNNEKLYGYLNGGRYTISLGHISTIEFTRREKKGSKEGAPEEQSPPAEDEGVLLEAIKE